MAYNSDSTLHIVQLALQLLQALDYRGLDAGNQEPAHRRLLIAEYIKWMEQQGTVASSYTPGIESALWRPRVGVGVMIIREEKVLLGRRKSLNGMGTYGWSGGHIEYGETIEECAKREAFEETRLQVASLKLLCLSNIVEYGAHYIDIEFLAEVVLGEPVLTEPDKVEGWNWYDLNNLPSPLFKASELAINSYLTGQFYNA